MIPVSFWACPSYRTEYFLMIPFWNLLQVLWFAEWSKTCDYAPLHNLSTGNLRTVFLFSHRCCRLKARFSFFVVNRKLGMGHPELGRERNGPNCPEQLFSLLSRVQLFVTPWTIYRPPVSSVHGFPSVRDLLDPGIESQGFNLNPGIESPASPAFGRQILYYSTIWEVLYIYIYIYIYKLHLIN